MKKGDQPVSSLSLGVSAILFGLLANKWVLGYLISLDGTIESPRTLFAIAAFQFVLIACGAILAIWRPRLNVISLNELRLVLASMVFTIAIVELAARIWLAYLSTPEQYAKYSLYTDVATERRQWSPHHYLNYYPTPNFRRGLTTHNSLGFRGDEFDRKKPGGSYRIVAIGGSTTYTVAVEDDAKTFTTQLQTLLRDEYLHTSVEVINAGVAGYNSWESLINFQFRVLDIDPDLVIVYHGTNDAHTRLVAPEDYVADNSGRRKQWSSPDLPPLERSALLRIVARKWTLTSQISLESFVGADSYFGVGSGRWPAPAEDVEKALNMNAPVFFDRNLASIAAIATANGIDVVLATWAYTTEFGDYAANPDYERAFQEGNVVVEEVANRQRVHFFDFASEMPKTREFWSDGRHVNELGAAKKAELFARFLDDRVLSKSGDPETGVADAPPANAL